MRECVCPAILAIAPNHDPECPCYEPLNVEKFNLDLIYKERERTRLRSEVTSQRIRARALGTSNGHMTIKAGQQFRAAIDSSGDGRALP